MKISTGGNTATSVHILKGEKVTMKTNHMPSLEVIEKVVEGRGLACPGCGHERLQSKQYADSGDSDD